MLDEDAQFRQLSDEAKQEIRIAAVLNGGVSLAVWMSGVTLELHHLALSSQDDIDTRTPYRDVLRLLGATARVDVIAGTSAGGLNGAFLALALAQNRDLALLRDVWTESGSLQALLRAGKEKNPPSLLQGDSYFLPQIVAALNKTVSTENPQLGATPDYPIELILTGTLWTGRTTAFTDDMGVGIIERDYDATFHFSRPGRATETGNLDDPAVISQLAAAARCTSSFPGAFEPHEVKVETGNGQNGRWPSDAGQANFSDTQYVLDGGVLLNKPIRPALEAIYRQSPDRQVRRVLTYIVPDPGATSPGTAATAAGMPALPLGTSPAAGEVLLGVATRLRSTDSVSRELSEIRDRNASVSSRRRVRARLSAALTGADGLAEALWEGYRSERVSSAAATIADLIAAGRTPGQGIWSVRELTEALERYAATHPEGFSFVPSGPLSQAVAQQDRDWHWGQTTVVRLGDMTLDLLKRAVWLAPMDSEVQRRVVQCRKEVARVLDKIREDRSELTRFWSSVAAGIETATWRVPHIPIRNPGAELTEANWQPATRPETNMPASNLDELDEWMSKAVPGWDNLPPPGSPDAPGPGVRRESMYG